MNPSMRGSYRMKDASILIAIVVEDLQKLKDKLRCTRDVFFFKRRIKRLTKECECIIELFGTTLP